MPRSGIFCASVLTNALKFYGGSGDAKRCLSLASSTRYTVLDW